MGSQLALKSRIASTASLEKIFNAQEMIASSHIAKARDVALNANRIPMRFDAVQAAGGPHPYPTIPIVKKDEAQPPRGCPRPHLGSWYGGSVHLLDHPRNGIAVGPTR